MTSLLESKREIRRLAFARRQAQPDKDAASRQIWAKLFDLPEYQRARTVMTYVDVRSEVRTQSEIPAILQSGRRVVVPYCEGHALGLFFLHDMADLEPITLGILEPKAALRTLPERTADVRELDLIIVPGVAFDRRGARLGHGKGYYDRLLRRARPDTPLVAIAFECQLFPEIPTAAYDVLMDRVITEQAIYVGQRGMQPTPPNATTP